jgi:dTMP kinase
MAKQQAFTIAFCGIDGSGKSTLAARMQQWIADRGIAAVLHKTRTGRSGLERLSNELGRETLTELAGPEGVVLMMTGIAWQSIKGTKAARRNSKSVLIFDRHVPCLLALAKLYGPGAEAKVRAILSKIPKPEFTIYVAVDPATAIARLESRGGSAKTEAFLRAFDESYRALPEAKNFTIADGNRSPDQVFDEVCGMLSPYIPGISASR